MNKADKQVKKYLEMASSHYEVRRLETNGFYGKAKMATVRIAETIQREELNDREEDLYDARLVKSGILPPRKT